MGWRAQVLSVAGGVERVIQIGCNLLLLVSGLSLLALLSATVGLRYGFHAGLNFAPDLSELLFAIFVMAGIAEASRQGVHVASQFLIHALAGKWRLRLALLIHGVTACVYLLLAWYALLNAIIANDQTSPVLQIPWSVGYGFLTLGLALVALCSIVAIIRHTLGGEAVEVDLADAGAAVT
jgi:TRAP-type C4-dicarboxylate transport system permease small subunit